MKSLSYFVIALVFLASCSKNEQADIVNPLVILDNNKLLMLKVDYQTSVFEGGTELNFNSIVTSDSIPMNVVYHSPGDFGDIYLEHIPTNDSIFFGTIIWMGTGERTFPASLSDPTAFDVVSESLEFPSDVSIKYINEDYNESGTPAELIDYSQMWYAIDDLAVVQTYMEKNAKIAVLKYTPSVGIGDPEEWDWYIMLYL